MLVRSVGNSLELS